MIDEEKYYTILNSYKTIKKKAEEYFYNISKSIVLHVCLTGDLIVVGNEFDLHFSHEDLKTITFSDFSGRYRLKKKRPEIIQTITNIIEEHKEELYQFMKMNDEWEEIKFSLDSDEFDKKRIEDKWDDWE